MAREERIRLSEGEHQRLTEYRNKEYGTDQIPFGVVVTDLLDKVEGVDND